MENRYRVTVTFYENEEDHPNAQSMDDLNAGTVDESFKSVEEATDYGKSFKNIETYRGFVVYDEETQEQIVNENLVD